MTGDDIGRSPSRDTFHRPNNNINNCTRPPTLEYNGLLTDQKINYTQSIFTTVNNHKIHTFIDTGSGASLIRHDTFVHITGSRPVGIISPKISLVSVTGESIKVLGTVTLPITLGSKKVTHTFHIIEPTGRAKPLLLGIDFLNKFGVSIHFTRGYLLIEDRKLYFLRGRDLKPPLYQVTIQKDVSIPPHSELIIFGSFNINPLDNSREIFLGSDAIFESEYPIHDLLQVADSIVKLDDNFVPINIANFSDESINLQTGTIIGSLHPISSTDASDFQFVHHESIPSIDQTTNKCKQHQPPPKIDLSHTDLNINQIKQVHDLLNEYADVFSTPEQPFGCTDLIMHSIDTGDSSPVKKRAYRTSPQMRTEIDKKINELLDQDLIEPSDSPWASPIIMVRKKSVGDEPPSYRLVLDTRALNKCTIKDSHPVPCLEETVDSLAGNRYFSVMDLSSGYHQIPMNPRDKEKTAFTTGTDLFQWKRCPMGLCNAGQTFQRLMEKVFRGIRWSKVVCYLDDICTFGKSFNHQLSNLKEVFTRLRAAGLKLNPQKCQFFCSQVTFLGHVVSGEGVSPDPRNLNKVENWPKPTNQTQVRGFCSLASYYRRFIKNFSEIAKPLNKLTQKDVPFVWDSDCEKAFNTLKHSLTSSPIVCHPNYSSPWLLYTDASNDSIGSVLAQKGDDGKERVIAYFSAALNKTEKKWSTFDREFYAIIASVRRFKHYLRDSKFTIITDHRPLLAVRKLDLNTDLTGKRTRWALELDPLDFEIIHKSGSKHANADSLSRYPHDVVDTGIQQVCAIESTCTHSSRHTASSSGVHNSDNITQSIDSCIAHSTSNNDTTSNFSQDSITDRIDLSETELLRLQSKDKNIMTAISWLDGSTFSRMPPKTNEYLFGLWKQRENLVLGANNLLYKTSINDETEETKLQVVIPQDYIPDLLYQLHGAPLAGHTSTSNALRTASAFCFWPRMASDINEYCLLCESCQRHAKPVPSLKAPLHPIQKPRRSHIAIDITEMPVSTSGHRYILTVTDLFTKYIELFPLRNQTAHTICQTLFDQYIPSHGLPISIHSDKGANFESQLFQDLMKKCGITKTRTTSYRPNCNGQVERLHKTIKDQFTRRMTDHNLDPSSWDTMLGQVKLCYNATVHSTTGFTPFFLDKGEEPLLPIHILFNFPPTTDQSDYGSYASDLESKLKVAYDLVKIYSDECKQQQAHYYNKSTRFNPYEVDELVMLFNNRRPTKLTPNWLGPYKVMSRNHDGTLYQILDTTKSNARSLTVHYNKLKPFIVSNLAKQRFTSTANTPKDHHQRRQSPPHPDLQQNIEAPKVTITATPRSPVPHNEENAPESADIQLPPSSYGRTRKLPSKLNDFVLDNPS